MAVRSLIQLSNVSSKCVFTTIRYNKIRLCVPQVYRQTRGFTRLRKSFKHSESSPDSTINVQTGSMTGSKLCKQFGFMIAFSGTTIVSAAIWEYECMRSRAHRAFHDYKPYYIGKYAGWRREMEKWWRNLSEGQKMFIPICFLNVLVFLAWRVPMFQNTMLNYFCANPSASVTCWPMILSTFSHYSLLHLAANMYALHTFIDPAVSTLNKEQFLAFYLTSGVVSSFVSYLYKMTFNLAGPSLGASGAIMSVVGLVCTCYPHMHLNIIFLPMYTFTAGMAVKTLIGIDTLGCILRWQYLDHAAHLGGIFFGIFWKEWGTVKIWRKREQLLTYWHELRKSSR